MSVNSKMTALADEIRTLSGTTDSMGLDAMAEHVADANTEISSQDTLIEQALTALEGKTAGSSEGGVKTCTVVLDISNATVYSYGFTVFENNKITSRNTIFSGGIDSTQLTVENVVCGTSAVIAATGWNAQLAISVSGDAEVDSPLNVGGNSNSYGCLLTVGETADSIVTITVYDDD